MSDPNKFINTYIDTIIAALHEQLGSGLQLKTQLKLANDLLQEKDGIIAQLNNEIENIKITENYTKSVQAELVYCQDKLRTAEENHNALKTKVSHMDTLTKQLADMKNEIRLRDDKIAAIMKDLDAKDAKISSLTNDIKQNAKLEKVKTGSVKSSTVKVQLNTKSKPKELPIDDDF